MKGLNFGMAAFAVAYIGIGSNMGDKERNIINAVDMLNSNENVFVLRQAGCYRTEPVGYTEQDWFVNTVAEIKTALSPEELLEDLLSIENKLGRVRLIHWGPRVIDLDLLFYDNCQIATPSLTVPHPRVCERAFVVVPLAELVPDMILPGGYIASDLAWALAGKQKIFKCE